MSENVEHDDDVEFDDDNAADDEDNEDNVLHKHKYISKLDSQGKLCTYARVTALPSTQIYIHVIYSPRIQLTI